MRDIERLHQQWIAAWVQKDAQTIDRMMTPEYVYIAPNGRVLDRQTILGVVQSPTYRLDSAPKSATQVIELASDAAALIHHSRGAGSFQGRAFKDNFRVTTIFVRRGRAWQIGFEQASPVTA
ncbi:MAG TPA: nuclear transport factor 2 family protein [Thermoanaerobaculia bacterium]|nr:nuclear transport factor 2 family protein [Thermoanaerobaculia bacterium]